MAIIPLVAGGAFGRNILVVFIGVAIRALGAAVLAHQGKFGAVVVEDKIPPLALAVANIADFSQPSTVGFVVFVAFHALVGRAPKPSFSALVVFAFLMTELAVPLGMASDKRKIGQIVIECVPVQ